MKIATFNVNGVNGRLPRLLEWLAEAQPDVACLQEIKTGDATFPVAAIEAVGYRALWHGQPRHHGVAVLARGPAPLETRRGLPATRATARRGISRPRSAPCASPRFICPTATRSPDPSLISSWLGSSALSATPRP
jgi:exonuclease III